VPHKITRPEVAKRLGIKAMAETRPGISYRDLARLFAASFSTVRDALRFPVSHWAAMLVIAPAPPVAKKHRAVGVKHPVIPIMARPGSRDRAKLVPPEPTVEYKERVDFDAPESVIDEKAQEKAITKAIEEQDRKLREGKGAEVE